MVSFEYATILRTVCLCSFLCGFTKQQETGFVDPVSQNFNERINSQLGQQILSYHNHELAYKAYGSFYDRADVDLPGFKKLFYKLAQRSHKSAEALTAHVNDRGGRIRFPVVQLKEACEDTRKSLRFQDVTIPSYTPAQTVVARTTPHICYFQSSRPDPFTSHKKKSKKKAGFIKYFSWLSSEEEPKKTNTDSSEKSKKDEWLQGLYGLEDALAMEKSTNDGLISVIGAAAYFKDPHTRHRLEDYLGDQVEIIKTLSDLVKQLRQYKQDQDYPLGEYIIDQKLLQDN